MLKAIKTNQCNRSICIHWYESFIHSYNRPSNSKTLYSYFVTLRSQLYPRLTIKNNIIQICSHSVLTRWYLGYVPSSKSINFLTVISISYSFLILSNSSPHRSLTHGELKLCNITTSLVHDLSETKLE